MYFIGSLPGLLKYALNDVSQRQGHIKRGRNR